jgi:hypothetical protein
MPVHRGRMSLPVAACARFARLTPALVLVVSTGILRAEERPSRAEQEAFLAETRRTVLSYDSSLPDFLCTLSIRRYETAVADMVRGTTVAEHFAGTITADLTYSPGNEQYTVTGVNGFKPGTSYSPREGIISTGEFGTVLRTAFEKPAAFEFVKWTAFRSRKAAIYSFKLDVSAKAYNIRTWHMQGHAASGAMVGLHGELCIDAETHSVLRLSYGADGVPRGFPVTATSATVEYDYVDIGGGRWLLPSRANVRISANKGEMRNEVIFRSYRRR